MNVLEKKYTVELTDAELHILQTALCERNQSLSSKLNAAEIADEKSLCKNELQAEMRKRYRERLERKRVTCEQLLNSLFDAEMRGEYDD